MESPDIWPNITLNVSVKKILNESFEHTDEHGISRLNEED